jgi:hypothetical protein
VARSFASVWGSGDGGYPVDDDGKTVIGGFFRGNHQKLFAVLRDVVTDSQPSTNSEGKQHLVT